MKCQIRKIPYKIKVITVSRVKYNLKSSEMTYRTQIIYYDL